MTLSKFSKNKKPKNAQRTRDNIEVTNADGNTLTDNDNSSTTALRGGGAIRLKQAS